MTVTGDRRNRPEDRSVERSRPSVAVTLSKSCQADIRLEDVRVRKAILTAPPKGCVSQGRTESVARKFWPLTVALPGRGAFQRLYSEAR